MLDINTVTNDTLEDISQALEWDARRYPQPITTQEEN